MIRIRFGGDLRQLAERLATGLNLGSFSIAPSEYPPHQEIGSAEVLGFEMWLQAEADGGDWFSFRLETEHAVQETFHGRMHDLSPWLARFVGMMCDLEAEPTTLDPNSKRRVTSRELSEDEE